ncbi:zinc finger protein 845-like [Belonocnema kinseyi]|uniref:zinc finger protein 845-like n=1 Tax=Belonocnema kinseyi TaxID=2817044 RepID=UPI00143DE9AC|nr:zinc finger protein 845-like [Belonocnema kinseyi]
MSDKKEHKCVLCSSKLESKEALQEHFRKHANKEIDHRGRSTAAEQNSDAKCDLCGKMFDTVTSTIRHRYKMHPNAPGKFYCPFCGMQFPLKNLRDTHLNSHESDDKNEEEHKNCDDCDVLFYNDKALQYHHRSVHKRLINIFQPVATPPPSNKIKLNSMNDALSVYYCHLCGAEYMLKFNLQQHLEKNHTQEEREAVPENLIKCTMCAALFCSKKAYDIHNTYHQPDDLYVTSEEQRLQTVSKVDQDFDIRRVEPIAEKYLPKLTVTKGSKRPIVKWPKAQKLKKTTREEPKHKDYLPSDEDALVDTSDSDSDIPLNKRVVNFS